MTNSRLLQKTRRILAGQGFSPQEEQRFLARFFALIWAEKITGKSQNLLQKELSPFLPPSVPDIPAPDAHQLRALFQAVPAKEEGAQNAFTPEILALAHETSSRAGGVFYTPWAAGKRLARETLDGWRRTKNNAKDDAGALSRFTACDPAAGAGGLIIPLWLELGAMTSPGGQADAATLTRISKRLYAADLDGNALRTLRLRAALALYAHGATPAPDLFPHLLASDSLAGEKISVWRERFPDVFTQGGFDAVLSNPPYIGQKHHKELFEPLRQNPRWQPYVTPKSDLLYLFFHLALEILKPDGVGGFLTTAYFAQASSAAGLRARLKQETALLRLIDLENVRLFSRAPGQHNLITVFQKTASKTVPCFRGEEKQPVSQENVYSGPASFLNTRPQDELLSSALNKMAAAPLRLKDAASVSNGLMTGCDKISAAHLRRHRLPGVQKGEGVFVLSQAQKDALGLSAEETEKLKPFFKNSDISSYTARIPPAYWLVDFFYPNDRDLDTARYPRLMKHLARFKPVLLARKQNNNGIDKQLKKGVYWFGSVRRRLDFEKEKLAAPQRARTNAFAYTPGPWYASSDVYFISAPKPGFSLWYLLALLNSAPYYAWLFYNGKRKGNMLELYSQPLENLPVVQADEKTKTGLETLARGIYKVKHKNQAADVCAEEHQINALVGKLFGLTGNELRRMEEIQAKNR